MQIPADTMGHDGSFYIIGHVSSRIRYDGSPSMMPHAVMLAMARWVLYDRAGGLCRGEISRGTIARPFVRVKSIATLFIHS